MRVIVGRPAPASLARPHGSLESPHDPFARSRCGCARALRPGRPADRGHRPRLRLRPAARPHRPGDAGLAQRRRHRHRHHRLPQPGRPALHLQVPLGAADGPVRAAVARPAPRLAGAQPAGAGRGAALDGVDAAGELARRVRPPRLPGGHALGLAGRRRRRLPHRPAARGGARHGLVAGGARLSAGDDPLRRHRLHLGRPAPGRRLELARGLPGDGAVHGRRGGGLGAADPQAGRRGAAGERGAQRPARLSRGGRPRSPSASSPPATPSRRWRASGCCRCSAPAWRRRCASAGPTSWRSSPASASPCRWSPGRRAGRASRPCSAA